MNKLKKLRSDIDQIDYQLLLNLQSRLEISREIGKIKKRSSLQIVDARRWAELQLDLLRQANILGIEADMVSEIYQIIHKYSLIAQQEIQKEINQKDSKIVKLGKGLPRQIGVVPRYSSNQAHQNSEQVVYGIQGGHGSFNDEAICQYLLSNQIADYQISYLHTTKRVLEMLDIGQIDFGLFAVSNSRGGLVEETTQELGKYHYQVVSVINIPVRHCLMVLPGVKIDLINRIMAHPQVFKQCGQNLANRYSDKKLESGIGDAIDNAKIAEHLVAGKLGSNTAVMGSERIGGIYKLKILDTDLQDDPNNTTNFLLVRR